LPFINDYAIGNIWDFDAKLTYILFGMQQYRVKLGDKKTERIDTKGLI